MNPIALSLILFSAPVYSTDLDFQNYEDYLYPSERGGEHLEVSPLSSEWVDVVYKEEEE